MTLKTSLGWQAGKKNIREECLKYESLVITLPEWRTVSPSPTPTPSPASSPELGLHCLWPQYAFPHGGGPEWSPAVGHHPILGWPFSSCGGEDTSLAGACVRDLLLSCPLFFISEKLNVHKVVIPRSKVIKTPFEKGLSPFRFSFPFHFILTIHGIIFLCH